LISLGAALCGEMSAGAAPGQPLDASEMLGFLVQSICLDAQDQPTAQLVVDGGCVRSRPMTEDDPVIWRKHDWGGINGPLAGWQASDAVVAHRGGVSFADQIFDFGAPAADNSGHPDAFFRFDANDGGDAIVIVGDAASAFLTQDGGTPGLQWFTGPVCTGLEGYVAWLLFKADAAADWRSIVAELSRSPDDTCTASRQAQAFTRYKLATETFPLQRLDLGDPPPGQSVTLPTIVSEHFDAARPEASRAMERFYYARGLGKVRWEAWSAARQDAAQSAQFEATGRCPPVADGGAPDDRWHLVDCRMWTNIVANRDHPGWRVRDFNWPPADLPLKR
jgi:hypothetical protein